MQMILSCQGDRYDRLNLSTSLIDSKMQIMMTCDPKYHNQCFRAEVKEHTSLYRIILNLDTRVRIILESESELYISQSQCQDYT